MWRRSGRRPWIDAATLTAALFYLLAVLLVAATFLAVRAAWPCPPGQDLRQVTMTDGWTVELCVSPPRQ